MLRRIAVLCGCLLLPQGAAADTLISFNDGLVTWTATGTITRSPGSRPRPITIGTPFELTFTFNPSSATRTLGGMSGTEDCMKVTTSGSLTIGGGSYATTGFGFTNAFLPGSNCSPGRPETQFDFRFSAAGDDPFNLVGSSSLGFLFYRDLLVQDAFPDVPMPNGLASFEINFDISQGFPAFWQVGGPATLSAVEQAAPVPEPGTLTMIGIGLAAVARRSRRKGE